jgi:hypothetical protein
MDLKEIRFLNKKAQKIKSKKRKDNSFKDSWDNHAVKNPYKRGDKKNLKSYILNYNDED